jgi:hypothetical protein
VLKAVFIKEAEVLQQKLPLLAVRVVVEVAAPKNLLKKLISLML